MSSAIERQKSDSSELGKSAGIHVLESSACSAESGVVELVTSCSPISLDETNRLARMLSRVDNKYVTTLRQFNDVLDIIRDQYSLLTIDDRRVFSYASCYYDDDFGCYLEHHQARRQRLKVRTREYVDSGLRFFEVKLKGRRGRTNKHRIYCDALIVPSISGEQLEFLNERYSHEYRKPMPYVLSPSLLVDYRRCTFVANEGGERVTVDFDIKFRSPDGSGEPVRVGSDFIIVETKSADGRGLTDTVMRTLQVRKASKCSKYCIGVSLIGSVTRNNNFRATLKRVRQNIIPSDCQA